VGAPADAHQAQRQSQVDQAGTKQQQQPKFEVGQFMGFEKLRPRGPEDPEGRNNDESSFKTG